MENKINIADLLRNCPQGMELNCTCADNVVFDKIIEYEQIKCVIGECRDPLILDKYGRLLHICCPKCVIFPKDKTTWEGFHRPFKDGDIIYVCDEYSDATLTYVAILKQIEKGGKIICHCFYNYEEDYFSTNDFLYDANNTRFATEEEKEKLFKVIKDNGYRWDVETKTLKNWTIQDAKDGDVIIYDDGWTCIFKCIHGTWFSSYCFITSDGEFHTAYETHSVNSTINGKVHLATKEQCNLFFQKIKETGYKWNPETKTLEKLAEPNFKVGDRIKNKHSGICDKVIKILKDCYLVENCFDEQSTIDFDIQDNWELVSNKFDIKTLKPFDEVLVRDFDTNTWEINFFSKLLGGRHFKCLDLSYVQCIPYKGNEHLFDTTNKCDEYYVTWES